MANIIKIKRSEVSGNPSTLAAGELAYSGLTDNGSNGGDRLYIGMGTETNGNAVNHVVIGGKFFTDRLSQTAGVLTASSAIVVDSNKKIDDLFVDNIELNGNTISTTDANGNLILSPNGTGKVSIASAYTLPRVDGSSGYILTTNGSGVASWTAPAASSFTIVGDTGTDSFSTGGTFTFTGTDPIDTAVTNDTVTISIKDASTTVKGAASFNSASFSVSAGDVSIKSGGVSNSQLANSNVTIGSTSISLGSTSTTLAGMSSVTFAGSTSGSVQIIPAAVAGVGTVLTLPATTGTVVTTGDTGTVTSTMIADGTIVNNDISSSAAIAVSKLAASTISGVTLGNNLNTLTIGSGLSGTSYNGSASVTIAIDSTVALRADTQYIGTTAVALNRSSGNLALTGITAVTLPGATSGSVQIIPAAVAGTGTVLTLPATTGTVVTTGDTGTVTNTMLAGSITNAKLVNSSVTVGTTSISLGASSTTLAGLTSVTSTSFTGALTGNASTASALATARTINGVSFDGSANITVTAAAGTLTGTSLNSTVVSSSLTSVGTISSGTWQGTVVDVAYGGTGTNSGSITGTGALTFTAGGSNTNVNLVPQGTGTVDVGNKRITSVAEPTQATDAATKNYVDAVKTGLDVKDSVRVASTAALTVTYNNGTSGVGATLTNAGTQAALTLDTIVLSSGDRVLIKDQASGLQNGIYTVTNVGSASTNWVLTRATDTDSNTPVVEVGPGMFTFVEEGSVNADNGFVCTNNGTITIGTTAITWVQFSGAGQITAGNGLTKNGNTIDVVGTSGRISVTADAIDIDSTYIGQTTITTLGTITTGTWSANTIVETKGGTGNTSYAKGDILYASAANTLSKLSAGADGTVLQMNASGVPVWATLDGGTY